MGSIPIRIAIFKYNLYAGVAQLAEQLTCNQQVVGSIPIASSIKKYGRVPEGLKGADCNSVDFVYIGSNPISSTIRGCSSVVEPRPSKPVARVRSPSPAPIYVPVAQQDRAVAF